MVRVSSPAKLRPWSELTAKMVMGVVPGLVKSPFASRPIKININKGTRGVHVRYDAVLLPFISIVRSPGRPVIV